MVFITLLLVAGIETTRGLIGNAILTFAPTRKPPKKLWERPKLMAAAIEEVMRYDSALQAVVRHTLTEVSLRGQTLPGGEGVMVVLATANPEPEPDIFNIRGTNNRHIGSSSVGTTASGHT